MGEIFSGFEDGLFEDELTELYDRSKPPSALSQLYKDLKIKFHMPDEEIEALLEELSINPN